MSLQNKQNKIKNRKKNYNRSSIGSSSRSSESSKRCLRAKNIKQNEKIN